MVPEGLAVKNVMMLIPMYFLCLCIIYRMGELL